MSLIAVIADNEKIFYYNMICIADAMPKGSTVKLIPGRAVIGDDTYIYISEPRKLRGLKLDRVLVLEHRGIKLRDLDEIEALLRTRGFSLYLR